MTKFSQARNQPYEMTVQPGRYVWCSCGESRKQPFCDGRHEDTGMYPVIEIIEETRTVKWCGCKSTSSAPFCDGTHKIFKNGK